MNTAENMQSDESTVLRPLVLETGWLLYMEFIDIDVSGPCVSDGGWRVCAIWDRCVFRTGIRCVFVGFGFQRRYGMGRCVIVRTVLQRIENENVFSIISAGSCLYVGSHLS